MTTKINESMKTRKRKFRPRNYRHHEIGLMVAFFAGAFVAIVGVLLFLNAQ